MTRSRSLARKPVNIPPKRRARRSPPFDPTKWNLVERLTRPGEKGVAVKPCKYSGRKIQFLVWIPLRKWHGLLTSLGRPALVLVVMGVVLYQLSLPLILTVPVLMTAAPIMLFYGLRYGASRMRLWENCTGFLVLDTKGKPLQDRSSYSEYFKAFATWEEAYLRPVVVQRLSDRLVKLRIKTRRLTTELSKDVRLPEPTTRLDNEVLEMHKSLTQAEVRLTPLLEEEDRLTTEISNLLLEISEDMQIRRTVLLHRLRKLQKVESSLDMELSQRADDYDFWLVLLSGKGLRIRFTWPGAIFTVMASSISALFSGTPLPLSMTSLPFLRYVLDTLGGVRALRKAARNRRRVSEQIEAYFKRLDPEYDSTLMRLPV